MVKVDYSKMSKKHERKMSGAKSRMDIAAENSPRKGISGDFAKNVANLSSGLSGIRGLDSTKNKFRAFFKRPSKMSPETRKKLKKIALSFAAVACFVIVVGGLWFFSYIQRLDAGIKSIDDIFRERELASVFYDRKGKELYKLFNDFNRDPLDLSEVPPEVKWAFLASEDVDFYTHQGFDPIAIVRCSVLSLRSGGISCGGSTITQQIVKIQTNQNQPTVDRKLQEILAAIKVEQAYTKDEILELYLQIVPFGSNLYGLSSASQFYFGKAAKDLTLAEAAILAGIIQNPYYYSPTLPPNPEEQTKRIKSRQENHVLNQLKVHMQSINAQQRKNIDDPEADDLFDDEIIEAAKTAEITYRAPVFTTKRAGHAVDYALGELQKRNYNQGEAPFTLTELQNGGYKIYTTIDYDLQQTAEQTVYDAVSSFGATYQFRNAALMTTVPTTGEIITMVGSRKYDEANSEGCDANNQNCLFTPQVNVLNTPQSPGSSTKPMGTYEAYRQGMVFPASLLPDVPIEVGGGFTIKNWNGTFFGVTDKTSAGQMLRESRNLPAIAILEMIGIPRFLDVMREFGYTTYGDNSQYGPSVILGGSDVLPIEHAQGYGVFATQGNLVQHEIISKIVDREGNIIYEHKPEPKKVGDERAAYLINQSLLNNHSLSWDGRDTAAKSGTSENSTDAWIVNWSPDYVTVAWVGNNNNKNMSLNAFGENAVSPWLKNYMRLIGDSEYFAARTAFPRPGGIVDVPNCQGAECTGLTGLNSGIRLGLEGASYPVDIQPKKVTVCTDQPNRLARPIDIALGLTQEVSVNYYRMPAPSYQRFLDAYLADQASKNPGSYPNGGPTESCDIDRTGGAINGPFFQNVAVTMTGATSIRFTGNVYTTTGNVTNVDFYFDCNAAANCTNAKRIGNRAPGNNAFDVTLNIPAGTDPGTYTVMVRATNGTQTNFGAPVQVNVGTLPTATFNMTPPGNFTWAAAPGGNRTITYTVNPNIDLNNVRLFTQINGGAAAQVGGASNGPAYNYVWVVPNPGAGVTVNHTFYIVGQIAGTTTGSYTSPVSAPIAVTGQ